MPLPAPPPPPSPSSAPSPHVPGPTATLLAPLGPALQPLAPLRPGQLLPGWRNLLAVGWIAVILALAAVWKSSWTLGFSTWWLGPQANQRFVLLLVLPFVLPLLVTVAAIRNMPYVSYLGIVAALATGAIGWGDLGRQRTFALVELAIAAGGLLVSMASLAGMVPRSAAGGSATTPGEPAQ